MNRNILERAAFVFLSGVLFFGAVVFFSGIDEGFRGASQGIVLGDDDEEDEEDEKDEEDEEDDRDDEKDDDDDDDKKPATKTVTRYEKRFVTRVVTVLPEEYEKDTDGDLLVDGVDPDPLVHQREYFTDTDGDAVPNAFDRHHDEDDFAYFDDAEDVDGDGVIDAYEGALGR